MSTFVLDHLIGITESLAAAVIILIVLVGLLVWKHWPWWTQ